MRVLITGAAGFLGTHLSNRLVAGGHTVFGLDDLSSGDPTGLDSRVSLTRGDVRDVPRLWSLLANVDVVYHLAAKVSVQESILYPVEYNAVNTGGTVAVLAGARDAGVRRVVLTSSGTVYGPQRQQPIAEDARTAPANPYGVSKLAAEHYVRAVGDLYRIETVILRIFNAYGPGQHISPAHPPVVPHFTAQIMSGASIVLHGAPPGAQTRDFVYVDDVVDALVRAGERGGVTGHTLNIGSGEETSLRALVAELERAAGKEARILESPEQSGGSARMCADIRAAESVLGWSPTTSLRDGLLRMVTTHRRERAKS